VVNADGPWDADGSLAAGFNLLRFIAMAGREHGAFIRSQGAFCRDETRRQCAFGAPISLCGRSPPSNEEKILRRALRVVFAGASLIVLWANFLGLCS